MATDDGPQQEGPPRAPRKDRLIQTRVPRDLETTLKDEAQRRRLTVSQLIRNILEDTFQLVDGVVADVDQILSDSVNLARNVRRSARRFAAASRDPDPDSAAAGTDLSQVYAWNEVVLHRLASCSACGTAIGRGERGFTGLCDAPDGPRAWLCLRCIETL